MTRERVDALRSELSEKDGELRTLMATATTDLWLTDLQALEEQLDVDDAKREAGEADAAKKAKAHACGASVITSVAPTPSCGPPAYLSYRLFPRRSKKGKKTVSKRAPKKKKTYDSDEESDGYDDDSEDDWGAKKKKAPVKKAPPKPKPAPPKPVATKPAPAKAPAKAKAAAKPKAKPAPKKKAKEAWETDEDEESDGFVGSDSDDDNFASSAPVAPRARSGRTAATKKTCGSPRPNSPPATPTRRLPAKVVHTGTSSTRTMMMPRTTTETFR